MSILYSEDVLVERPAIALFAALGWQTADCFDEVFGDAAAVGPGHPCLGRETTAEAVLQPCLRAASVRLNP
jgi:type I restriction enzyme R subunit